MKGIGRGTRAPRCLFGADPRCCLLRYNPAGKEATTTMATMALNGALTSVGRASTPDMARRSNWSALKVSTHALDMESSVETSPLPSLLLPPSPP